MLFCLPGKKYIPNGNKIYVYSTTASIRYCRPLTRSYGPPPGNLAVQAVAGAPQPGIVAPQPGNLARQAVAGAPQPGIVAPQPGNLAHQAVAGAPQPGIQALIPPSPYHHKPKGCPEVKSRGQAQVPGGQGEVALAAQIVGAVVVAPYPQHPKTMDGVEAGAGARAGAGVGVGARVGEGEGS